MGTYHFKKNGTGFMIDLMLSLLHRLSTATFTTTYPHIFVCLFLFCLFDCLFCPRPDITILVDWA